MFARIQDGLRAELDPWLIIARGLDREHRDSDGTLVGQMTDEVTLRGIWSHWKKVMLQESPAAAVRQERRARQSETARRR
jgi:hypothetical protein